MIISLYRGEWNAMSQFTINSNINAINQQMGDKNIMKISSQEIEIDWEKLQQAICAAGSRIGSETGKTMHQECCNLMEKRNKEGIKKFLSKNFKMFSKEVLCSLSANAFIELIKILL